MTIAGIIAEYNPFHNGHAYHIEHTRAEREGDASHVVAVMSGWFTQRGEPALCDPFTRAEAALRNGVDLVIALPVPWVLSSAQHFAEGGVHLLNALNCVDMLSFGSECGNLKELAAVRRILDTPRAAGRLRGLMDTGLSYAAAQRQVVAESGSGKHAVLLDSPNNTLAVEYLGALSRSESSMTPFTVSRMGAGHDALSPIGGMASASYVRELIRAGRVQNIGAYVPNTVCHLLIDAVENGRCPSREALAERAVLSSLRLKTATDLECLPGISEGLENRLYRAIREAHDLESLITLAKTKRYARTRLQRLIYCAFLGITADLAEGLPPYIRVLGFNDKGRDILHRVKENSAALPVITRAAQVQELDDHARRIFELECTAADLYGLFLPSVPPCGAEMTTGTVTLS